LLLASAALHVRYSQEIRNYSMLVFWALATAYALHLFLRKGGARVGAMLIGSALLFMNAHYIAVLGAAVFFGWGLCAAPDAAARRRLLAAGGVLAVLEAPMIFVLARQYLYYPSFEAVPKPSWRYFAALMDGFHGGSALLAPLFLNLAVWGLVSSFRRRTKASEVLFLLCWCAAPLLAAALISWTAASIFMPRYFVFLLPAYLMLAAHGLMSVPWKWLHALLALLLALGTPGPLAGYFRERIQSRSLKEAYLYAGAHYRAGDVVLHTMKFSFVPALFYHDQALDEFMVPEDEMRDVFQYWVDGPSKNVFQYWYARKSRMSLAEGAGYRRIWICSAESLGQETIERVLRHPALSPRRPRLTYRAPSGQLILIDLEQDGRHGG
jgi:hypothetical protein